MRREFKRSEPKKRGPHGSDDLKQASKKFKPEEQDEDRLLSLLGKADDSYPIVLEVDNTTEHQIVDPEEVHDWG